MANLVETYLLVNKARAKLTKEASNNDHDLRVLVCHANLLDSLMESLENHRNNSYSSSNSIINNYLNFPPNGSKVTYIDDDLDSDSDSDDDSDNDDAESFGVYEYRADSEDEASDSDEASEEEEEEEEDPWKIKFEIPALPKRQSHNLPTITEESDITDISSTSPPSLSYSSTTDEEESEDSEESESEDDGEIDLSETHLTSKSKSYESLILQRMNPKLVSVI